MSDTSPVLNLARIGRADLLCSLYGEIIVPLAVAEELSRNGIDPDSIPCLVRRDPSDLLLVRRLESDLDAGESAAIALAVEIGANLLLADERKGRARAAELGLRVVGLLGVLGEAKRQGLIPDCRSLLDALQGHARFWISSRLRDRFLYLAGE